MTRREMCTFNEIFGKFDTIKSEQELTERYGSMSLAQAARVHIDEMIMLIGFQEASERSGKPIGKKTIERLGKRCFDRLRPAEAAEAM